MFFDHLKKLFMIIVMFSTLTSCKTSIIAVDKSTAQEGANTSIPTSSPKLTSTLTTTATTTSTSTPTPTITPIPTATVTSTPFGGGNGVYYYSSVVGLKNSKGDVIVSESQVFKKLGEKFDKVHYFLSPDFSSLLLLVWPVGREGPVWGAPQADLYLTTLNLDEIVPVKAPGTYLIPYSWSPNGSKLLMEARHTTDGDQSWLYVVNNDGSNLIQLSRWTWNHGSFPEWSHDGSEIFWNYECYFRVYAADKSNVRNVELDILEDTRYCLNIGNAGVSPSGEKIAIVNNLDGLYIMNSDFSDASKITRLERIEEEPIPDATVVAESSVGASYYYKWSPDEKYILLLGGYVGHLSYLIQVDNGETLMKLEYPKNEGRGNGIICGFTPDSKNVVYIGGDMNLYFIEIQGKSTPIQITHDNPFRWPVVWACPLWSTNHD